MADGTLTHISKIKIGDNVCSFNYTSGGRGAIYVLGRVVRLFRMSTPVWLRLQDGLTATPSHEFRNEFDGYERLGSIVARGGSIVKLDGSLVRAVAERIVYSSATRHLYEEAEEVVCATAGGLALKPEVRRGWRTYNFEVEHFHNYVAGGYRVHNDSYADYTGYIAMLGNDRTFQVAYDALSTQFSPNAASSASWQSDVGSAPGRIADQQAAYDNAIAAGNIANATAALGAIGSITQGLEIAAREAQAAEMTNKDPNPQVQARLHADADNASAVLDRAETTLAAVDADPKTSEPGEGEDPLVLNLAGGLVHTTSLARANVQFDPFGAGFKVKTGWIAAGEAFLTIGRNLASVNSGRDLVATFGELAAFDGNHDGRIDANDQIYQYLGIWQDSNLDAVSLGSELRSLAGAGIASIDLNVTHKGVYDNGNLIQSQGSFTYADGHAGQIAEAVLLGGDVPATDAVFSAASTLTTRAASGALTTYVTGSGQLLETVASGLGNVVDLGSGNGQVQRFNALDYIASYADLRAGVGANATAGFDHYLRYGLAEGRTAVAFSGLDLVASYAWMIGYFHTDEAAAAAWYIQGGYAAGYRASFNDLDYIASYGDLIVKYGADETAGVTHYINNSVAEHRSVSFDGLAYIASNPDLIVSLGASERAGALHYIQHGYGEGRAPGGGFDPARYLAANADMSRPRWRATPTGWRRLRMGQRRCCSDGINQARNHMRPEKQDRRKDRFQHPHRLTSPAAAPVRAPAG